MQLYRLGISPGESAGEGENLDEWFGSREAAERRRRDLIRANPTGVDARYLRDFAIDLVEIVDTGLNRKQLALLLLNGRKFILKTTPVVDPYEFDRDEEMRQVKARLEAENITSTPVQKQAL